MAPDQICYLCISKYQSTMDGDSVRAEPFPAKSKRGVGTVNGVQTEVESLSFSDKIMITVSQGGRLAQWVSLQLQ